MTRRFHTATTLLAGLLLAACTQDMDTVTRAVTGDAVPLQLAVSLGTRAATRISDATVQTDGTFRGIEDIKLIPFSTATIVSTTLKDGDFLRLELLLKPTAQSVNNTLPVMTSQNTALYKDVDMPIGTSGFLFYGRASQTDDADAYTEGRLTADGWDGFTSPSGLTFSLQNIFTGSGTPAKAERLAEYMTGIANATASGVAWKDYTVDTEIAELYAKFITNVAGSSNSVRALLQDLYTNLQTNYPPDIMAQAVIAKIGEGADITDGTLSLKSDYAGYPENIGLPDGTAYMKWDDTSACFVANTGENIGISVSGLTDYVYPPCLYYRANSGIKTSRSSQQGNYDDTNSPTAITGLYTDGTVIDGYTKSVVLTEPIQYAVGRFDMTVKCDDASLVDHNNTAVTVPTGGFPVTAVFVAGQKPVDWEFKPLDSQADRIVYDNKISGVKAGTTPSAVTHTLVLETAAAAEVTVAIEMENTTGLPFTGNEGQMIYAGSRFYLVGKLAPADAAAPAVSDKVFEQDRTTTANFTVKDLKKAYNAIPDLRAPHLELGISIVDSWSSAGTDTVPLE